MRNTDVKPKNFLRKEVLLLKMCGLFSTSQDSTTYKIYSFVVLFLTYSYPFMMLIGALRCPNEVDFDTIFCLFALALVLAKITVVLRKRSQITETLLKLGRKPFIVNLERGGNEEERLFNECVRITTVQTVVYVVSITCHMLGPISYTLSARIKSGDYHDWKLPFGKILIFNLTVSPSFEIAWAYQTFSATLICFSLTGIDLITFFVLCHVSYQFKFLQNSLRRTVKNTYERMIQDRKLKLSPSVSEGLVQFDASKIPWKYLHSALKGTVLYHLEIINIATEMENVFNTLFLIILLYTTIILCFMAYGLSMVPLNDPGVIPYIVEMLFYCVQVAILCFWGEQATIGSEKVASAAFEADFVGTDRRFQQGLMLLIRRSQSPVKITAAKFTNIRLSTFVWIMRATYSSFMLLQNIHGK